LKAIWRIVDKRITNDSIRLILEDSLFVLTTAFF
jgi:hypothetical protein